MDWEDLWYKGFCVSAVIGYIGCVITYATLNKWWLLALIPFAIYVVGLCVYGIICNLK